MIRSYFRSATLALTRACDRTRIRNWPTGRRMQFVLFAQSSDPDHVALALDSIQTYHPGSTVVVACDAPIEGAFEQARRDGLDVSFAGLAEARSHDAAPDIVLLAHPWPYISPERTNTLRPVVAEFRRYSRRHPEARCWILTRTLVLFEGRPLAGAARRALGTAARWANSIANAMEDRVLGGVVAPILAEAAGWDAGAPCLHESRTRVFTAPRTVEICRSCGMGITPADSYPAEEQSRRLYGDGYATRGGYVGSGELRRVVQEEVARVDSCLRTLGFREHATTGSATAPRVFDYGCGNGRFARLWLPRGYRYLGVDPSEANVAFARQTFGEADFISGDVGHPGIAAAGPFEVVFVSHVLEHVPDPLGVLAALRDVTAPGGQLWLEVPDALRYTWTAQHRGYGNYEHVWDYTEPMLAAIARAAGWSNVRTHRDPDSLNAPFIALLAEK